MGKPEVRAAPSLQRVRRPRRAGARAAEERWAAPHDFRGRQADGSHLMKSLLAAMVMMASLVPAFGAGQQPVAASGQEGRILFVGSSIFRRWTNLTTQM